MRVVMTDVISLDGKITRAGEPKIHAWTSPEEKDYFKRLVAQHNLIVMDRKSFEAVRPRPQPNRLRVVLTRSPHDYASRAIPGSLEFTNVEPEILIAELEGRGYKDMMLAGGSTVAAAFLQRGLVDELYITIEPLLFGKGTPMIADTLLDVHLRMIDLTRINAQGTLVVHYEVEK